ncbi:MAG TPA: hypothetical protein VIY66_06035 [Candidatus Acidoferrales bacterium]
MITMQTSAIAIFATTMAVAAIAIVAIIIVAAIATLIFLRSRTKRLQTRFGPEYNRTVEETGNRYKAEAKLQQLEKRVERYPIRPLSVAERDRFQQSWRAVQAEFVDDPIRALTEADQILAEAMSACGYPMSDFEQRAQEISVDHAIVVEHYRSGHDIVVRQSEGKATTEELRQAMIHYRALFDELMGEPARLRTRTAGAS